MTAHPTLTLEQLKNAVSGSGAAIRLRLRLHPAGGPGDKVFPPTYEGGNYATEERRINGQNTPCVLLDSVASQANRAEIALLHAWRDEKLTIPVVSSDFSSLGHPGLTRITSLEVPHRIADAILRDSLLGKEKFRQSAVGKKLDLVTPAYATPLFEHCPTALVFGIWDSTGPRGGLGVKFARALSSEMIGVGACLGKKTASRIDPLNIQIGAGILYRSGGAWTIDENLADKEPKKKTPVRLGEKGKPSEANHGNVTPTISEGGFTIDYAEQTTVLSLPGLRRLRFPTSPEKPATTKTNDAARTYLAALGLLGVTLAIAEGYDLRSRCTLVANEAIVWELLGAPGEEPVKFSLPAEIALQLASDALIACDEVGLPFHREEIVLTPIPDLLTLVRRSIELAAGERGGD